MRKTRGHFWLGILVATDSKDAYRRGANKKFGLFEILE
jgi:hypothetical protein